MFLVLMCVNLSEMGIWMFIGEKAYCLCCLYFCFICFHYCFICTVVVLFGLFRGNVGVWQFFSFFGATNWVFTAWVKTFNSWKDSVVLCCFVFLFVFVFISNCFVLSRIVWCCLVFWFIINIMNVCLFYSQILRHFNSLVSVMYLSKQNRRLRHPPSHTSRSHFTTKHN